MMFVVIETTTYTTWERARGLQFTIPTQPLTIPRINDGMRHDS